MLEWRAHLLIRIAFITKPHDREIIAWQAVAGSGISGGMIRDPMLEAVEERFGGLRAPQVVERLTGNGGLSEISCKTGLLNISRP